MSSNTKNKNYHHELFTHIAQQRDMQTLNSIFVNAIEKICPNHEVRLYLKSCGNKNVQFIAYDDQGNENDQSLLNQMTDEQPVLLDTSHPNHGYTALPLQVDRIIKGALILEGGKICAQLTAVKSLITLYTNQVSLLNTANRDALTDLYNRQAFEHMIGKLLSELTAPKRRSNDAQDSWFFAMLDIDDFKKINDEFGHLYGDKVLLNLSRIMAKSFRDDDLLFRYGGEEFAVATKVTDTGTAQQILERFRKNVAEYAFPQIGHITTSVGYCEIQSNQIITTLTNIADKALCYAKKHGKNQVQCYEQLVNTGKIEALQ